MQMYIGGQPCDAANKATIDVINPATGAVIDTIPKAAREDVDRTIKNSVSGQEEWAKYPLHRRIDILNRFVTLAMEEERRKEMALALCKEMGKPYKEAYGDFNILKAHFEGFISAAKNNLTGTVLPFGSEAGKERDFDVTIREPLGTILCILAFNAPLTLYAKKVAPALLTGNSVIVKPASEVPLTILMLSKLMLEAGVPGNAYQIVTGSGGDIGDWLTADPRIAGVTFTGSTEVGVRIATNLGRNLKYQSLELGGNAPLIVCEDADLELSVNEAMAGRATYLSGQICSVAKRFLVHRSLKDAFVRRLVEKLKAIRVGDPMDSETQMGTLVSERAAKEVERQVNLTVSQGAELVFGGKRDGAYYGPTVLDNVKKGMDIAHNMEVFGPVFPIIVFDTVDEAIEMANDTQYGLGSGVMTRDMKTAMRVATALKAGNVVVNGQTFYRNLQTPFGGYKMSGLGREGQTATLLAMTQIKNIVFKGVL